MMRAIRLIIGKLCCRHRWRFESRTQWAPAWANYTTKIKTTYVCTKCGKFEMREM